MKRASMFAAAVALAIGLAAAPIEAPAQSVSRNAVRVLVPVAINVETQLYKGSQDPSQQPQTVFIFNDSSATLYVAFGAAGDQTDFSMYIAAGTGVSAPLGYVGPIWGLWPVGTTGRGARITTFQ